ncbi:hypothetical protein [Marinimicrobium sp. ARAG 43.8]|uniref:hypothetical protein n=1 Tax=Marinimicrobium sp. ARAG 43.8 TaxID=3418719 RepID=UPI003CFA231D
MELPSILYGVAGFLFVMAVTYWGHKHEAKDGRKRRLSRSDHNSGPAADIARTGGRMYGVGYSARSRR